MSTKKLTSHQTPSPQGIQGEPRKTEMTTMMMMLVFMVMMLMVMMRWDDHHHDNDCDLWQICEESNGENRENVTEYCAARCSWTACHRHYDDDDDDDLYIIGAVCMLRKGTTCRIQKILLFLLFIDTFRIQRIWSFLLFIDTTFKKVSKNNNKIPWNNDFLKGILSFSCF